jgi:hypothetical protein
MPCSAHIQLPGERELWNDDDYDAYYYRRYGRYYGGGRGGGRRSWGWDAPEPEGDADGAHTNDVL